MKENCNKGAVRRGQLFLVIGMASSFADTGNDSITDSITNDLCFTVLSIQIFIILFIKEIMKHVTILIFMDSAVLIGLLAIAVHKMMGKNN